MSTVSPFEERVKTEEKLPTKKAPSVFEYRDYRAYLSNWWEWKRNGNSKISGATFARQAGLQSHSLLSMVIRGKRNLGYETIRAFGRAMNHTAKEQDCFEKLVLYNQAKNPRQKKQYLDELHLVAKGSIKMELQEVKDYQLYLGRWFHAAIRELITMQGFRSDPDWIAKKLKSKISRKQVKETIELLLKLGLVQGNEKNLSPTNKTVDIEKDHVDAALKDFHVDYLERSKQAAIEESFEDRFLSSTTVAVPKGGFDELRKEIRNKSKEILERYAASDLRREELVAVNTQVLLLTEKSPSPIRKEKS